MGAQGIICKESFGSLNMSQAQGVDIAALISQLEDD